MLPLFSSFNSLRSPLSKAFSSNYHYTTQAQVDIATPDDCLFTSEQAEALYQIHSLARDLSEENYTFTHGQGMEISVYTDLFSGIFDWRHPEKRPLQGRSVRWRAPYTYEEIPSSQEFFRSWMKTSTDNHVRESILSVDGHISNLTPYESAASFFLEKTNVALSGEDQECGFLLNRKLEIENFNGIQDHYFQTMLSGTIESIQNVTRKEGGAGRIYLIAIPKILLQNPESNFAYRSHPFGKQCECFSLEHSAFLEVLDRQQAQESLRCKDGHTPQYRLIVHGLQEADGVIYHERNSLPEAAHAQYEAGVKTYITWVKFIAALETPQRTTPQELSKLITEAPIQNFLAHSQAKEDIQFGLNRLLKKRRQALAPLFREAAPGLSEGNRAMFNRMLDEEWSPK